MAYEYFVITWENEGTSADDEALAELLSKWGKEGWRVTQTTSCPGAIRKLHLGYSNADYTRDKYKILPILTIFLERFVK